MNKYCVGSVSPQPSNLNSFRMGYTKLRIHIKKKWGGWAWGVLSVLPLKNSSVVVGDSNYEATTQLLIWSTISGLGYSSYPMPCKNRLSSLLIEATFLPTIRARRELSTPESFQNLTATSVAMLSKTTSEGKGSFLR